MTALISIILMTSFLVLGMKIATGEGMLLAKLGEWADKKEEAGYKIFDALLLCPYCMPSFYSIAGYLIYWQAVSRCSCSWRLLLAYPVVVCGASILSGTIWSLHNLLSKKHEYYESVTEYYRKAEQEKFLDLKDRTEAFKLKQSKK